MPSLRMRGFALHLAKKTNHSGFPNAHSIFPAVTISLLTIYLTLLNWPADHFLSRVFLVLFVFWVWVVFCVLFGVFLRFLCFFWIVTAPWTMYRSSPAHLFEAFDE